MERFSGRGPRLESRPDQGKREKRRHRTLEKVRQHVPRNKGRIARPRKGKLNVIHGAMRNASIHDLIGLRRAFAARFGPTTHTCGRRAKP